MEDYNNIAKKIVFDLNDSHYNIMKRIRIKEIIKVLQEDAIISMNVSNEFIRKYGRIG